MKNFISVCGISSFFRHIVTLVMARINGRKAIDGDQKFALDVWYVDNHSIGLDWKIIGATIKQALNREGISAKGEATMPKFTGPRQ